MKTAQELRVGNVVMVGSEPLVVLKAEYNKSGRNSAVVKLKFKNLLTASGSELAIRCGTVSVGLAVCPQVWAMLMISVNFKHHS